MIMKKILSLLLSVLLLAGCYEDLGNYDYTLDSMNEITSVTFTPLVKEAVGGNVIEIQQALDENDTYRCIDVQVEQTLAKDLENLEFYWFRTFVDESGEPVQDTVRTKGYLEFHLPVAQEMSYNIFLQIYDTTTDLSHYSGFTIKTRPMFKNSLFVMHGSEGGRRIGNIEVIGDNTNIYSDIKDITDDNNNYKNATGFGYTTYYNIVPQGDSGHSDVTSVLTIFGSNGETKAYDPHDKMRVKFKSSQIFKPESENFSFRRSIQTGPSSNYNLYRVVLTDSGEVYFGNYVHALYKPGEACGDSMKAVHQTDYKITAATITNSRFLLWDAKYGRFLYAAKEDAGFALEEASSKRLGYKAKNPLLNANVSFQGLKRSPADMTAVLGYINYHNYDSYSQQNPYFIFKDEETGDYYRYELLMQDIGDGSKAKRARVDGVEDVEEEEEVLAAYTIVSEKMLKNLTPTDMSTITYNSWFTTNNLFFAEGNTVYRYNVSNGDRYVVYEAPQGYNVTKIKFRTEDSATESGDLGRYMNIVMYNGTNGAIAEIKLTTAADVDNDFAPLFYEKDANGKNLWGEIKDIIFVHEYIYQE